LPKLPKLPKLSKAPKRASRECLAVLLVALSASLVAGCSQKKVEECNQLAGVINDGLDKLEARPAPAGEGNGVAELTGLAEAMDQLGQGAAKVTVTQPELQKIAADYQAMTKDVAQAARDMAAAATAKDEKKLAAAEASLQAAVKKEDPLVTELNRFCHAE
jgi:multidrug resistance efflux pump